MSQISVKYNQENWVQDIVIVNPLLAENNKIQLNSDFISSITLSNYIYKYSPRLTIQYNDVDYRLLNFIQLGTTVVYIHMRNDTKEEGLNTEGVAHDVDEMYSGFIIDDIKMINQDKNGATILLKCVHSNVAQLCKKITYANNKTKGQLSPLRIIQDLLSQVNYNLCTNYVETDVKIDFTSVVGQRINQMVDYLLRRAVTPKIPPTYMYHNITNNQAMLYNRQLIPDNVLRSENVLYINTSGGIEQYKERRIISEVKCQTFLGGMYMFDQYGDYIFHNYDHLKRKWKQIKYRTKDILNVLTDNYVATNDKKYTTDLYYDKENIFNSSYIEKRCYEFPNQNDIYIYDYLKDLELFSSTLSFKCRGETVREVGQLVKIESKNPNVNSFYGGFWTITEIVHTWENSMFIDEIMCHRTIKTREDIDKSSIFSNNQISK